MGKKVNVMDLKKNLDRGLIINLYQPENHNAMLSVIKKIEMSNIYFRLPREFLREKIFPGDSIEGHIFHESYEYVLKGKIINIMNKYPHLTEMHVTELSKYKNRRQAKRFYIDIPVSVFIPILKKTFYAIVKDISSTGFSAMIDMLFKDEMEKQDLLKVEVKADIPDIGELEFSARVVREHKLDAHHEFGMEIFEIDDENKDLLDKLIFKLEKDEKMLISEYLK
jgi:c-di-GMP-binding flagellar brake protein YcgR